MCNASTSSRRSRSCHIPISAAMIPILAQDAPRHRSVAANVIRKSRPTAKCRAIPRLSETARQLILPHSRLKGVANILIMPNLDAANVAYQMIKVLGRRAAGRSDPDRPRATGAHSDAVGDGARHSQHDGGGSSRGAGARRAGNSRPVRLKYDGRSFFDLSKLSCGRGHILNP